MGDKKDREMALPTTRLEVMDEVLGTKGMGMRYWPPDPQYARMRWWRGRAPPQGHIWAAGVVQTMLGVEECERLKNSPFSLRRRLKPPGATSRPRVRLL